jgi:MFS family permease
MAVAIALLGLCPNIVLSTAFVPLSDVVASDLGTGRTGLQLAEGMSNAGYACGAVVAAALAQRYVQRNLFLGYQAAFVVGSLLATFATGLPLFFLGRVVQGASTGLMLISALPPLVTRFGVGRLPLTVAIVNVGLFGATTIGPVLGGLTAEAGSWRVLMGVLAGLGTLGWLAALLGYVRFDPMNPDLPWDRTALLLAVAGTSLAFFGTSVLTGASFTSPVFLAPFAVGILAIVVLVVLEYRKREPLMPVEALSTQLPVTGMVVAMLAGAVFVTVVELVQLLLADAGHLSPAAAGTLFWPMPVGLVLAAAAFGVLFRTRYVPVLVNVGILALAAGAALLLVVDPGRPGGAMLLATGLLGFGAGATVSPGLFLAGLGVPATQIGRAFALVELLRSMAAYAVGPVVAFLAQGWGGLTAGVHAGLWVTLSLAGTALVVSFAVPALSGARLRRPDLEGWLDEGRQALPSPRTGVHVRRGVEDESAEPLIPEVVRRRR